VALPIWPVEELIICKMKRVYFFICGTSVYIGLVIMWNSKYPKAKAFC